MVRYVKFISKRIKRDSDGTTIHSYMSPTPDFPSHGVYFFSIPLEMQPKLNEGHFYLFKYSEVYDQNKKDKKGRPMYTRKAIPLYQFSQHLVPDSNGNYDYNEVRRIEKELNEFTNGIMQIIKKGIFDEKQN